MLKLRWMMALCLVSSIAGLLRQQQINAAAPPMPNGCNQFQCKNVVYLWDGTLLKGAGIIKIFAVQNSNPPNQALQGIANIFSTTSSNKLPNGNTFQRIDIWSCPGCVPSCGLDANKVWQIPQDLAPAGIFAPFQQGIAQFSCGAMPVGQIGPIVNPPVNANPNKLLPPGWPPPPPPPPPPGM
jgi:formin 2/Wiskott-Aldrich syndrome protein